MKLKLKHLRHPVQSAKAARAAAAERRSMGELLEWGERHYAADPRFDAESVDAGFVSRLGGLDFSTAALERICAAYRTAAERETIHPALYGASPWWRQIRQSSLGPVLAALRDRDLLTLRGMYRNFFRDPCSSGLVGAPYGIPQPYEAPEDPYRKLYLVDALLRLDRWTSETRGRFPTRDLAGPGIGNPFGLLRETTLIESGAEYRHYCAHRIIGTLGSADSTTVVEIGGGFGGMAYYLLRDRPGTTYVNFDIPETLALAAFYLMSAFPDLAFRLYGEPARGGADITLLPSFELPHLRAHSAGVIFSSHTIAQLSPAARAEYWKHIGRISSRFLYIGAEKGAARFPVLETQPSGWNDHRHAGAREIEALYASSSPLPPRR